MSKLDVIFAENNLYSPYTAKDIEAVKEHIKELILEVIEEPTINMPTTYKRIKEKVEAL